MTILPTYKAQGEFTVVDTPLCPRFIHDRQLNDALALELARRMIRVGVIISITIRVRMK